MNEKDFIDILCDDDGQYCEELRIKALSMNVPIIKRESLSLIKTIIAMKKPQSILEVGTGIGYSAAVMSTVAPEDCHIWTIEKYEPRFAYIDEVVSHIGSDKLTSIKMDAAEYLSRRDRVYDMIFMDAAKGQYIHWLEDVVASLEIGGILISDNCLQDSRLPLPRNMLERRDRTIHSRMREYLYRLMHDDRLVSSILSIGDGVAISVKK